MRSNSFRDLAAGAAPSVNLLLRNVLTQLTNAPHTSIPQNDNRLPYSYLSLLCLFFISICISSSPFIAVLARKIICWLRKPETEFSIDERNLALYRFVSVLMALFSRCRCFLLSFAERKSQPLQIFAQCPCKAWFMLYLAIFTNANIFLILIVAVHVK